MAQLFLVPNGAQLDEDGNPFPSTGLSVTMTPYYEEGCRQGDFTRVDRSVRQGVAQPAVYAPVAIGYVTTQLSGVPGVRDGQTLNTIGYSTAGDGGGAQWRFALGVSSGADGLIRINCSNGQWSMVFAYTGEINILQLGCKDDGVVDCGTVINSFMTAWQTLYGQGSYLSLFVPPIVPGRTGYRLAVGLAPPDGLYLSMVGGGVVGIDAFGPSDTPTLGSVKRAGAVFVVSANVHGLWSGVADTDFASGAHYKFIYLENVGFLGPGAANTTHHGIYAHVPYGNFELTTSNVRISGFNHGFWLRNAITNLGHYRMKVVGCNTNYRLGGGTLYGAVNENVNPFNVGFRDCRSEFSDVALHVNGCQNVLWSGGLLQSNNTHIEFGNGADTTLLAANVSSFLMDGATHLEGHNNYSGGHQAIEVGSGGSYSAIAMYKSVCANPQTLTIPSGSWSFKDCSLFSTATFQAGAFVVVDGPSSLGGFTTIAVSTNTRYTPPSLGFPGFANSFGPGTYTHDWANTGCAATLVLTGNATIDPPTNACENARLRFEFRQDAVGGRTVTFAAGIRVTWSNVGNVANTQTGVELVYSGGIWKESAPQRAGGWAA